MKILKKKSFKYFINFSFLFKFLIYIIFYSAFINFMIKKNKNLKKIPKISIFLPIYNKNKYLLNSIKSIQKQTLKDIEIIGVNDCSTDNSLNKLKKISKIDSRIKIINNDRNHGLLYSRTMGILNSTGEFLLNLDPDDEFVDKNNLEYLYKIAKIYNVDILNFAYKHRNKDDLRCKIVNKIIKKPILFKSAFDNKYQLQDYLIWNKFIKRKIMLKAYEIFKNKVYSQKWNYHEDNIWSILVYKYSNSMLCINNTIYLYNSLKESLMHQIDKSSIELKNLIYKEEMLEIILDNKNYHKYIIGEYNKLINRINKKLPILNSNFKIKSKFIKIIILCIKLYKCPNYIINKIKKFINFIEFNQFTFRQNN